MAPETTDMDAALVRKNTKDGEHSSQPVKMSEPVSGAAELPISSIDGPKPTSVVSAKARPPWKARPTSKDSQSAASTSASSHSLDSQAPRPTSTQLPPVSASISTYFGAPGKAQTNTRLTDFGLTPISQSQASQQSKKIGSRGSAAMAQNANEQSKKALREVKAPSSSGNQVGSRRSASNYAHRSV